MTSIESKNKGKKVKLSQKRKKLYSAIIAGVIILLAAIPLANYLRGSHAASSTSLYLSPSSQSVNKGSTVVINIVVDPGGASINTVQTVFNFSTSNFTLVSIVPGAAFGSFPETTNGGTLSIAAASTTAITTVQTVATITLQATGLGSSNTTLASVCPAGNYALTCSAAYDAITSNNDLGSVASGTFDVIQVVPTTPTLSTTGNTNNSVSLSWNASSDTGGPGLGGYNVFLNGSTTPLATLPATTTTYTATGLSPSTSYSFTVSAFDTGTPVQTSTLSNSVSVKTPALSPSVPTSINKTSSTFNSITLSWAPSTEPGGSIAGYAIYQNAGSNPVATTTTTSYTLTGLTSATAYNYTIASYDSSATPIYSAQSSPFSASTNKIGDIDGDGSITGHDLSILLTNYGKTYASAQFDGTSTVEGHDLSLLLTNYGK